MKILIVEDDEALAKILEEKFKSENFDVAIAPNGAVVMEMTESLRPDIILLDLILPKKPGLDVLAELKTNPEVKMIPVIVLSNLEEDESIKKALALGAIDYYVKTQHPLKEIMEKVKNRLVKPIVLPPVEEEKR